MGRQNYCVRSSKMFHDMLVRDSVMLLVCQRPGEVWVRQLEQILLLHALLLSLYRAD